ncbi:MAG: hypothetical protein WAW80_05115 [Candidatus Saccharimonadales bacterium]
MSVETLPLPSPSGESAPDQTGAAEVPSDFGWNYDPQAGNAYSQEVPDSIPEPVSYNPNDYTEGNESGEQISEPQSPEEELARVRLEDWKNRIIDFRENTVAPARSRIGEVSDKLNTLKDKGEKRVLLLDRREAANSRKVLRVENRLAELRASKPDSIRYRHLKRKAAKKHLKLRSIRQHRSWLDGRIEGRPSRRAGIETARDNDIVRRRQMLIVAKQVATEKARRRKIKNHEKSTTNTAEKEQLRTEIESWDTISRFKHNLIQIVGQNLNREAGVN